MFAILIGMAGGAQATGGGRDPFAALSSLAAECALVDVVELTDGEVLDAVFGVAVGRVVTLAFLMVQLVSAGGIYPVETTAKPFQVIHPYVPMTYSVNGLRQLVSGGIDHRLTVAVMVLIAVLAASMLISAWAIRRSRQYTMEQLHPPIEV